MKPLVITIFVLVLAGCNGFDQSLPTGMNTTIVPTCSSSPLSNSECRDQRIDQPFSVEAYRGVIAFGLGHPGQTEEDVLQFVAAFQGRGWNTFEICSETEYWLDNPELPNKPRDVKRLRWILDLLARVPGVQVALVGNCTLKRQIPLVEQRKWAQLVAAVVNGSSIELGPNGEAGIPSVEPFKNVAIFAHNEFDNCSGRADWGGNAAYCAGKQDVAEHIRIYRAAGIEVVTADDSFRPPKPGDPDSLTYGFRLANIGASPASFHPDREKNGEPWDPSLHQLQELGRHNGLYILSETVAWSDGGHCDGFLLGYRKGEKVTCDPERIPAYIARCAAVAECRFTFHCLSCLAGEVPNIIPEGR